MGNICNRIADLCEYAIARRRGEDYEIDLVLRNNLTTEEHPLGVFHPHADKHNIKKENIGLIEVMDLAVLPSRLKSEMALLPTHSLTDALSRPTRCFPSTPRGSQTLRDTAPLPPKTYIGCSKPRSAETLKGFLRTQVFTSAHPRAERRLNALSQRFNTQR